MNGLIEGKWKPIDGTNGKYQASIDGEIRRVDAMGRGYPLRGTQYGESTPGKSGLLLEVKICVHGRFVFRSWSRLIYQTFIGEIPEGMVVVHKNGIVSDNRAENLALRHGIEHMLEASRRCHARCVEKIDRDGNVLELYASLTDAAADNFVSKSDVYLRCRGKLKDPFKGLGYTFRYEEGNGNRSKVPICKR